MSTLLEISKNVASVPFDLTMRTLPASSATNSLPSGANSMSMGPASPLATWDWVKPFGTAPWAGLMASASKVPTAVSKVSVIAASGRRALLTPNSPSFLSLRFNHKGFATDVKLIAKLLAFAIFTVSGSRFDGRVAFRSARKAAFGPPGGPIAGFRRLRWRAQLRQKRRNYPMDPHRCQSTGVVASLPRQPQVRNAGARQP